MEPPLADLVIPLVARSSAPTQLRSAVPERRIGTPIIGIVLYLLIVAWRSLG